VAQLFAVAPRWPAAKSHGNYPAITHIMSAVFEGGLLDFDAASTVESRYFAACAMSQASKNMIGTLWYQLNAIKKGASRPQGVAASQVGKLGILGAGMMGAGIAHVSAKAGIEVVLLDTTQEAAERGKAYSQGLLDKAVERGRSTADQREALLARITPTTDFAQLAGCDLVIEAVFEDRAIKAEVTQRAEAVIGKEAVFASNTSTLPISGLAQASARPKHFLGLHFFSPVDKMPLVEIIVGAETSDETLARGFDYVLQIGKTPIVVNDSARLLHQPRLRHLRDGRHRDAEGGRAPAQHRGGRVAGRHADAAAGAAGRGLAVAVAARRRADEEGPGGRRQGVDRAPGHGRGAAAVRDRPHRQEGGEGLLRPQVTTARACGPR
jgi:3-hydroxyacyl-CoA dehydrogenase / enoyl-CoA hydratase / 3-hydroxybutyryl-CoA epimerase